MPSDTPTPTWDCQAYGPEIPAEAGALCFFANPGDRSCHTETECHDRLHTERQRVFRRINEMADAGDPDGAFLAAEFTHPEQLLGGAAEQGGQV